VKPESKENGLLSYLIQNLDFGQIRFKNVFLISCLAIAQNFSNCRKIQIQRLNTNPKLFFQLKWMYNNDGSFRQKTIQHYINTYLTWDWNKDLEITNSPVLAVVHGTDIKKAWSVASGGFANLSLLDSGFYGSGMYFSSSAFYTIPYFVSSTEPAIIICFVIPSNPYPVIEFPQGLNSLSGTVITRGCQSHYVVTTLHGLPFTEDNYLQNQPQFNEIVIDQEAQILPIFILEVDEKSCKKLGKIYQQEIPQNIVQTLDQSVNETTKYNRFALLTDILESETPLLESEDIKTFNETTQSNNSLLSDILESETPLLESETKSYNTFVLLTDTLEFETPLLESE